MAMDRSRTGIMRDFSVHMVPPGVSYCALGSVEGLGGRWCRGMREGGAGVVWGWVFWGGGDAARYVVVVVVVVLGADLWTGSLTFLRHGLCGVGRIAATEEKESCVCWCWPVTAEISRRPGGSSNRSVLSRDAVLGWCCDLCCCCPLLRWRSMSQ